MGRLRRTYLSGITEQDQKRIEQPALRPLATNQKDPGFTDAKDDGEIQSGRRYTPAERFIVSGNLVTDLFTGLMWPKNPAAIIPGGSGLDVPTPKNDWAAGEYSKNDLVIDRLGVAITPTAITGITNALPAVVTADNHGLHYGQRVQIAGVVGMTEVNDQEYYVWPVDDNNVQLYSAADLTSAKRVNSGTFGTYTSGGSIWHQSRYIATENIGASSDLAAEIAAGKWVETHWTATADELRTITREWADSIECMTSLTYGGVGPWSEANPMGWRSPSAFELFTLANFELDDVLKIFNTIFSVPMTYSTRYWSSTTNPGNTSNAYEMQTGNAIILQQPKAPAAAITCMPVRSLW